MTSTNVRLFSSGPSAALGLALLFCVLVSGCSKEKPPVEPDQPGPNDLPKLSQLPPLEKRPRMGVNLRYLRAEEAVKWNLKSGVAVSGVLPGSPADTGGIRAGDVLLKFDGKEVTHFVQIVEETNRHSPGQKIQLEWLHEGKRQVGEVVLRVISEEEELKAIRSLVEKNDPHGFWQLGLAYLHGHGVRTSTDEGLRLLTRAAEAGHAQAQLDLAAEYESGVRVGKDEKVAFVWVTKAAEQGEVSAHAYLAHLHCNGKGTEKNFTKGREWARKAAEMDHPRGQALLGLLYYNGDGGERNDSLGVEWMRKAAQQHDSLGQRGYGHALVEGRGINEDARTGIKWLERASEQGDTEAMVEVAFLYHQGRKGVSQNLPRAIEYLKKAREKQSPRGTYLLALAYERGEGVTMDRGEAIRFYREANKLGSMEAKQALTRLGVPE